MIAFLGVDPGLDGALASIRGDGSIVLYDTPTGTVGSKRVMSPIGMLDIVRKEQDLAENKIVVALERVHAMSPNMKVSPRSMFSFGEGYGMWEMLFAALGIPVELVTPQRWKGVMLDGMGKEKDASRIKSLQLYPQLIEQLGLKKHHGRGDALLIDTWRQRIAS